MFSEQNMNVVTLAAIIGVGFTQLGWLPIGWAKLKALWASKPTAPPAPPSTKPPDLNTVAGHVLALEKFFVDLGETKGADLANECGQLLSSAVFKRKAANGTA